MELIPVQELKERLQKNEISTNQIALTLGVNKSTIVRILNDNYKGSENTKNEILESINYMILYKTDLNPIIYSDADHFINVFRSELGKSKFTLEQNKNLIRLVEILQNYKQKNNGTH